MKFIYVKILFLCLALLPLEVLAQGTLKGIVRDQDGILVGATVFWQNSANRVISGVTTNENGEYFLPIPPNAKELSIMFSFIGLKTQQIKYTGQKVLNITLAPEATSLDEVVVSAKAKQRDNMGLISDDLGVARQKLDLDDFQDMAVTSVEDMLQGKLTNVDIIAGSGDPGVKSSIRIRGTSSLNASNEPLIVIDGTPTDTDIDEDFDFGTADVEDFGSLINISPNDIQSIEVLKDAAATALWGSTAANGVLLITTKRGQRGKPSFSVSQKFSTSWEPKAIRMLNANEYVTLMQDALWNKAQFSGFKQSDVKAFQEDYKEIRFDPSYEYFDEFNQETDWLSLVVQNPFNSETDFSMSGGGDRATYRFSVGYLTEKGTTIGTDFKRITARLNLDYYLSKKLKVSSSFSYAEGNRNQPYSSPRNEAMTKMPNMSPWVLDENGNPTDEYFTAPKGTLQGKQGNPLAMVNDSKNNTRSRTMDAKFNLNYTILAGLRLTANIAFTLTTNKNKLFYPSQASGLDWFKTDFNKALDGNSNGVKVYTNTNINYNKAFQKHHFTLSATLQTTENNSSSHKSTIAAIGSGELADPSGNGKVTQMSSSDSQNRKIGINGSFQYNFGDRYIATAQIRSDANSSTGRNSRWGTFPSLSAQWHISNESFIKSAAWVSDIRIKGSWGKTGNAPKGSFTYVGTLTPEDSYMDQAAIKPNSMQLNKLKWETTTSYNFGIVASFFNDKVSIDFDYYRKWTDDLLQSNMGIASSTGYSSVGWYNSGKTENQGFELAINLNKIVDVNGFTFSVSNLNIARNRNKILELPDNKEEEAYKEQNAKYANKQIEGRPLGAFFGYNCLGVYQNTNETYARDQEGNVMRDVYGQEVITSIFGKQQVYPGDARYADHNYDGIINKYDMVYLGNSMPFITGGGAVRFGYKGLSLRASFHFRLGQKVINQSRMDMENMYGASNQRRSVLKRWRYEGDDTDIPRALYGAGYNYLGSDRFVENNSFLKCKDITLSYSLPKRIVQRWGLSRCNFYVTTYNIFTITKYKGQDPETSIPSGFSQLAQDNSLTPRARKVALGITVDF